MNLLFVWVRCADGSLRLAGRLGATDPASNSGRFKSEFEYAQEWTGEGTFPIDPESLPLNTASRRFSADLLFPPLGVFNDALPDDWGRNLLAAALRQEGCVSSPMEMLRRMRGGGTGALIFTNRPAPPEPDTTVRSVALSALVDAAEKFEAGNLTSGAEFQKLLEGSSRAGGARPKALVHDSSGEWLVKFPSKARDSAFDVIGLEATCLELAQRAGLEVPESRLQTTGRRRVLMVRRFDITAQNGRLHMISLSTLCKERPGIHVHNYSTVAQAVRRHSAAPAADVAALFRQMIFNAAIGNVDDHLKNFWMLADGAGYRLSPAFDLVPDVTGRGAHTLAFQSTGDCPDRAALISLADAWAVPEPDVTIDQVAKAVAAFASTAHQLDVHGPKTLAAIAADVDRRLQIITR